VNFLAGDTWEAQREFSVEPVSASKTIFSYKISNYRQIPTLIIKEQGRYEDATKAIRQLVISLLSHDHMMPSFVTSWTESLLPEHRLLLCIMFQTFPKPRELYDVCFKRREPNLHQLENVQRQYLVYVEKAVTLPDIRLTLETILGLVYWSRMLKD
jgi:hypothetical protein